jgi:hypothetical protein
MKTPEKHSISALSDLCGLDRRTTKKVLVAKFPDHGPAGWSLVELTQALVAWSKDTAAGAHARTLRTELQCQLLQVEAKQARREVLPVADVEWLLADTLTRARVGFLELPARMAPDLAGQSVGDIFTALDIACREILTRMAHALTIENVLETEKTGTCDFIYENETRPKHETESPNTTATPANPGPGTVTSQPAESPAPAGENI